MTLDSEFWKTLLITLTLSGAGIVLTGSAFALIRRSPAWRKSVWQVVFIGMLLILMAELTGTGGSLIARLLPEATANSPTQRKDHAVMLVIEQDSESSISPPVSPTHVRRPVVLAPPSPTLWPLWGWGILACILVFKLLLTQWMLARFRGRCAAVQDRDLLSRLRNVAETLEIRRRIILVESEQLQTPIAFGMFRPTIGVPKNFTARFSTGEQDAILAHELGHHHAADPFWRFMADVVTALWWWHPLVWWARRNWKVQSELTADQTSAATENGPQQLAECLVKLGRELTEPRRVGWMGMAGEGYRSHLGKRVEKLLVLNQPLHSPNRILRWTLSCVALTSVLGTGLVIAGVTHPAESFPSDSINQRVADAWNDSLLGLTLTQFPVDENVLHLAAQDASPVSAETTTATDSDDPFGADSVDQDLNPFRSTSSTVSDAPPAANVRSPEAAPDAPTAPPAVAPPGEPVTPEEESTLTPAPEPAARLFTRSIEVDPNRLKREMNRYIREKHPELIRTNEVSSTASIERPDEIQRAQPVLQLHQMNGSLSQEQAAEALTVYLSDLGVEVEPPKMIYLNDASRTLLIRATPEDHEIIKPALEAITRTPPTLQINTVWVELSSDDVKALGLDAFLGETNNIASVPNGITTPDTVESPTDAVDSPRTSAGLLTQPQYQTLIKALEQRQGVDIMFSPRVTTLSGHQTQIKTVDIRTVVTGLTTNETGIVPTTEVMEFGPVFDVIPHVSVTMSEVDLTVVVSLTEFVGYDDPGEFRVDVESTDATSASRPELPLPVYKLRQASTTVAVMDNQTLVLGGMTTDNVRRTKNKVPVLGHIPFAGRLFQSEITNNETRHLFVFITPTIITEDIENSTQPVNVPGGADN